MPMGFDHSQSLSLATEGLLNHELQHAPLGRYSAATGSCDWAIHGSGAP